MHGRRLQDGAKYSPLALGTTTSATRLLRALGSSLTCMHRFKIKDTYVRWSGPVETCCAHTQT